MKKIICLLLSTLLVLSLLAGCGQTQQAAEPAPAPTTQEAPKEETSDTMAEEPVEEPAVRSVTDLQGRVVELPEQVETVAALGSAPRLMVYAGCADKIIALTGPESDLNPSMPYAYVNHDHFATCTAVAAGGSNEVFTEELAVLQPDLILYNGAPAETLDALQTQLEIPVVGLYSGNFDSQEFHDSLALVGEIMGTQEHTQKVLDAVDGWIEDLDNRTRDIPEEEKPTVYTGALGFSGPHGFDGTSAHFAPFDAVNAINVADETDEKGTFLVDLEKVTQWDPDYVFLNPAFMNIVNEDYALNPTFYDNLSAVKNGNVYSMVAYNFFWANQELAIADAYYVGSIIYPEEFADINFEEKAEEIFNTMLGTGYLDVLNENGIGFTPLTIGAE